MIKNKMHLHCSLGSWGDDYNLRSLLAQESSFVHVHLSFCYSDNFMKENPYQKKKSNRVPAAALLGPLTVSGVWPSDVWLTLLAERGGLMSEDWQMERKVVLGVELTRLEAEFS